MKPFIALDIDGTITDHHTAISQEVLAYFCSLSEEGYPLAFITGRTFPWAYGVLSQLSVPYFLAIHNGALILQMPERKILTTKYLDKNICPALDEICREEPTGYVVYGGYEAGEACYYVPEQFRQEIIFYLQKRIQAVGEDWLPLNSFRELPIASFASVRYFGDRTSAERISSKIQERLQLHAPISRDPFDEEHFVVQATHPQVDKGMALTTLKSLVKESSLVIAAGDDLNDIPMLEKADVAIGMETAPQEVLSIVDIIAPSAKKNGIITGIQQAINVKGL